MKNEDKHFCLNCGHEITLNFCPNCGQKTSTDRYNVQYIGGQLADVFDIDRGFFKTLLMLLKRPGKGIHDYIKGKRKEYTNPLKLMLIVGALATYLTFKFELFLNLDNPLPNYGLPDFIGYHEYSVKYFTFTNIVGLPLFALFTYIFFLKSDLNYIENIVINAYIIVGQFLVLITMAPFILYFNNQITIGLYGFLNSAYNLLAVFLVFRTFSISKVVLRTFVSVGIPSVLTYYLNFLVYLLIPNSFWSFLDTVA